MRNIVLFGGSFDPIHNGHLAIAKYSLKCFNADKVIFILAKNPRWKQASDVKHRYGMLKLALKNEPLFEISDYEIKQNSPVSYSIDTVKYYRNLYKNDNLYFIIGFDQLDQLDEWHDIEKISKLVKIVAFARRGYPKNHEAIKKFNVKVIETMVRADISSTKIRVLKSLDTTREIIDYIIDNDLYFCKTLKAYLTPERYLHSISVARTAYDIAKGNNIEPTNAYLAGLLHDVAKNMDKEEMRKYMEELYPDYVNYPQFTYHQWIGSLIASEYFSITNQNILDAIMYHTTGRKIMSTYDKILYASDKIEPLRGFDSKELIAECMENLERGWVSVLKSCKDFFNENHIDYTQIPLSKQMYENYLKGE